MIGSGLPDQSPDTMAILAGAQEGVRRHARRVALSSGNVLRGSAIVLLAASSIVAVATANPAPAIAWITGLGSNILAGYIDTWLKRLDMHAASDTIEGEWQLTEALATDLQRDMTANPSLADDVSVLLHHVAAFQMAFAELRSQGEAQEQLLQLLLNDVKGNAFRSEKLINLTLDTVLAQGKALRGDLATLLTKVDALLAEGTKASAGQSLLHIENQAPNFGAQGVFHAPVNIGVPPKQNDS